LGGIRGAQYIAPHHSGTGFRNPDHIFGLAGLFDCCVLASLFGAKMSGSKIRAVVIRTTSGFTALSLVCTHLGCTVESKPEGFACPCHGSRFDIQGGVTRGPAAKPLRPLRVEVTKDGHLHIHTD